MSSKFNFDHLGDVEFEEYCFDLLSSMGCKDIDWRKGTGLNSSPADKGRDIECTAPIRGVDNAEHTERWFVQCKRYKKGVPAGKIKDALYWAEAERPDVLLFIISNFLSNQAKEYIETYEKQNKPKFRIKVWELPVLKDYSQGKTMLLSKYKLADKLEYLNIMHPAHLEYIKSPHFNKLDDLFELLDLLSDDERMRITGSMWEKFLQPRYKQPVTGEEAMGELLIDPVDYRLFKEKCYEVARNEILPEYLLTNFLVNQFLQEAFSHGDTSSIGRYKARMRRYLDSVEEMDLDNDKQEEMRSKLQSLIDNADDSFNQWYKAYTRFCDEVVSKLLLLPGGSID